jgi:hypothetical protein
MGGPLRKTAVTLHMTADVRVKGADKPGKWGDNMLRRNMNGRALARGPLTGVETAS